MSCSECQTLLGQRFVMLTSSLSFLSYNVASPIRSFSSVYILAYAHKINVLQWIDYLLYRKRSRVMKTIICDNMS